MEEIGRQLRAAREAQGRTLQEIERKTRIRARYLQALEEGDFAALPGQVYVRGFLRTYAQELGLDPEPLLAAIGPPPPSIPRPVSSGSFLAEPLQPTPLPVSSIVSTLIVLTILAILSVGVWWGYPRRAELLARLSPAPTALVTTPTPAETPIGIVQAATATPAFVFAATTAPDATSTATPVPTATNPPRPTSTPTTAPPTETPEVPATPEPTATPESTATPEPTATPEFQGVHIAVEIVERAWIWVMTDGQQAFMGTLPPGERREFQANETLFIRTGNGGGVRLFLNGQDLGILGQQGEVVNRTWQPNPDGGPPILLDDSGTSAVTTSENS